MKKHAKAVVIAMALLPGVIANAREPFENEWLPFPPPVAPTPDPFAFIVPDGLYYVIDTYVADVVSTSDATTTYSTTTVHESTGSYARAIDTVDTGASSAFDGLAFNGRGTLRDGRPLAGTYYETFVQTTSGYVPVSIVFFQDDSETRRLAAGSSPSPSPSPVTPRPTTASLPSEALGPSRAPVGPGPSSQPSTVPIASSLRAGIALAPDGPTLASAEVLRGRLTYFWPRAFANDVAVPVRSWRLLSAAPDRVSANIGGIEPLAAQWIRMPAPDVHWPLRFEIFAEGAPNEPIEAQITITVRSPALIQ
jgi:hypothetical protein